MSQRLDAIAPDLVPILASASPGRLRRIACRLAELVAARVGFDDQVIVNGLTAARRGEFGESPVRQAVREFAAALDERYWEMQDLADTDSIRECDHLALFSRSRAASALDCALDADPHTAASETLYEAFAALGDLGELRRLVAGGLA
jgi:hypothetical protein